MYKRSLGTRVWIIADKYGIEQTKVHSIITSYISFCRDLLLSGNEVTFFNLVTMTPDYIVSDYRTTFAYQCKMVSESSGVSYYTVYSIVREYLDFLQEDIMSGNSVDIRGIVSLHPLCKDGVVVKVHSSISTSIKRDLSILNGDVSSIRAHTHNMLKHAIKSNINSNQEVIAE